MLAISSRIERIPAWSEHVYDRTLVQATERGQLHGQVLLEHTKKMRNALRGRDQSVRGLAASWR